MAVWDIGGKTVLLVLHCSALRRQLRQFARNAGLSVLSAESGGKGLEIASTHPGRIDLLLSEFRPPDMHGCELLSRIRKSRPSVQAIMISPEPEEVLSQMVEDPRVSFLETPFSWSVLADRLTETLNGPSDGTAGICGNCERS